MEKIIPRWEWRTFGSRFGIAEAQFAKMTPTGVQESDELYLIARDDENVKIRDASMDIKLLREVDQNGLERWEPVMKQGFPLSAAHIADVCAALNRPTPPLRRETYTLDELLAEMVAQNSPVRAVKVHKRRVRYKVGGCTSEVTEIRAEGKSTRSIAIESEDAAAVVAAVASVGLGDYFNISYPHGLRDLVDAAPQRYAVIDVGTNSIKFHIAERTAEGLLRALVDRAEMTRLGEGLNEGGDIGPEAIERTVTAIAGMVDEAKRAGVLAIAIVGTAGLRMARNGDAVVAAIRERIGVAIEVISGEEEGRLAYVAATAGLGVPDGSLVVFDTGGGSSQFTFGHGARVDERFSVNVGAVRYTERFGLDGRVSPDVLKETLAAIAADLSRIDGRTKPDLLVAMGGAITNIAAVKHKLASYHPDVVQGSVLERAELDRQIELYRTRDSAERRTIIGLQPKRAEIILAGACIVRTVMDKLGQDTLRVSDRGLRHGVLAERFGT